MIAARDAHAFLAAVYKNPRLPLELRILAASRALRAEKPVPLTVHESPYYGLADQLRAARKLAPPPPEIPDSTRDQTLLIGGGGWTTTEARTPDLKRCTLRSVSVSPPREGGDMTLS